MRFCIDTELEAYKNPNCNLSTKQTKNTQTNHICTIGPEIETCMSLKRNKEAKYTQHLKQQQQRRRHQFSIPVLQTACYTNKCNINTMANNGPHRLLENQFQSINICIKL